jgi:hypothetical protein
MLRNIFANFITRGNPHLLKRAQRGLYAGKTRLSGHRISFSNKKYVDHGSEKLPFIKLHIVEQ